MRLAPEIKVESTPAGTGIEWRDSPVYKGSTKFPVLGDVKNIMVTGGAGFIASWLVRHLTLTYPEYRVISYDIIDYCASLNNTHVLDESKNFSFRYGNVTNIKDVTRCIKDYNIDTIFHFAAQSHVDLSFGNSFEFTKTNVEGTHVMLESAVKLGIKRFIHISTDEVNGEVAHGDPDLLENSLLAPTNPYAASKAAAEMYVNAYAKSFKLPVIIVRSNNVYGPHQYPEKIIPKFACLLDRGKPLILHGDGTNKRRYLFAGDAADAFDTLLHKGQFGEIYNVGSRDEISNHNLCFKMLEKFGIPKEASADWIRHVRDRPFNDTRYAVDAQKLRSLGWEQKTSFEEGLEETVQWYRQFGKTWWGDIESILTPFPEVRDGDVYDELDSLKPPATPNLEIQNERPLAVSPFNVVAPAKTNVSGGAKKRAREHEGKENMDMEGNKRAALGEELSTGKGEVVRWLLPHTSIPSRVHSEVSSRYSQLPKVKIDLHPQRTFENRYSTNKTALYIEPRAGVKHITPLLVHMMEIVPPEWRFVFLGTEETTRIARTSGAARRYEEWGKLRISTLDKWTAAWGRRWDDLGIDEMNSRLLTNATFYEEELAGVEHLFVFHSDGILCANSHVDLNEWLQYDWVGAPWDNPARFGGNGGLSLRRVSKTLEVLQFQKRLDDSFSEDVWLAARIGLLPGANMATPETEREFAVEDIWAERPMGYHINPLGIGGAVWDDHERRKMIYEYCPEIKIVLDMRLERERCIMPLTVEEFLPEEELVQVEEFPTTAEKSAATEEFQPAKPGEGPSRIAIDGEVLRVIAEHGKEALPGHIISADIQEMGKGYDPGVSEYQTDYTVVVDIVADPSHVDAPKPEKAKAEAQFDEDEEPKDDRGEAGEMAKKEEKFKEEKQVEEDESLKGEQKSKSLAERRETKDSR